MTRVITNTSRPRRLSGRTRKSVLLIHIVSAGAWIGIDVVMAVFVFTAVVSGDGATTALSYRALEMFAVWPLLGTGVLCLASGVILGLGSKYGLVRYWWVAVKLVLNVALVTLVLLALRPGVYEAAEQARLFEAGEVTMLPVGDLIFPPVVSTTALLVASMLAVFKPWGRTRKGTARAAQI